MSRDQRNSRSELPDEPLSDDPRERESAQGQLPNVREREPDELEEARSERPDDEMPRRSRY